MADVKWIKLVTDIFDDEKILLIESIPDADAVIVIWLKLLCLAGKNNNHGVFMMSNRIPYTDEMLATIFRRPINTIRMALSIFQEYGMIEIIDGVITIRNWEKHQSLDALEKKREYDRQRIAKIRSDQKLLAESRTTVVEQSNDCRTVDKNRKDKNRLDKNRLDKSKSIFSPPSVDEVRAYCLERNNNVDPEHFVSYYSSNGWMVGKNRMKDWKAAVRSWEKNEYYYKTNDNFSYFCKMAEEWANAER